MSRPRGRDTKRTVDKLEGEGETESDDGLTSALRERYEARLAADLASDSSGTADEGDGRRQLLSGRKSPRKAAWSDDEEFASLMEDEEKSTRRKRSSDAAKNIASTSKELKRRRKSSRKGKCGAKGKNSTSGESEDDDIVNKDLPDYVKKRRAQFDSNQAHDGDATGLYVPPSFEEIEFSDDERMESLQEKPLFPLLTPCAPYEDITLEYSLGVIPAPIAQWLRQYQVEGVSFLHELFVYQKGGILGDDMGLGKTIQIIACLTAAFGKTGDERDAKRMRKMRRAYNRPWYPRVLIVCPGGLMNNWASEFNAWGWWNIGIYHGTPEEKENALGAAKSGRLEVMITTYTTYRLNKSKINSVEWDCVIADECHQIKEPTAETTMAMNEVNALCRIGLTGTAIQNSYEELWTLLNWTNPGRFGPLSTWKSVISDPLRVGQAHDATVPQLAAGRKTAERLVRNLLPEFFLRRMKTLIAHQLPKKSDRVVFCPLTEKQADAYENFVGSHMVECIRSSTLACDCGSGKKRGWCCGTHLTLEPVLGEQEPLQIRWQSAVFPCIVTLQKLANHLATLIPSSTDPTEKQIKDLRNLTIALPDDWEDLYSKRDNIMNYANPEFCGKWKILKRLLRFWHAAGDKVLVFSHSVRLLKMLRLLFSTTTGYNVSYLDGSMSYGDRSVVVDQFNADPKEFVFLISTKAGGVGLNITSANKVVVVDPNWNPSYDLQAQDRAYRIGQTRDVEVFRLVSAGTIEEIVYARQIYKQQQANIGYTGSSERRYFTGVQSDKEKKGEIFGLANLFSYQGENVVLRDIVNRTNVAESKAGVQVVGLDLESVAAEDDDDDPLRGDDDDEDAAMSQLAALIKQGDESPAQKGNAKKRRRLHKTDPIQAILRNAGVVYTHENSEVIGSSKVEARLSKRAMETGNDVGMMNEHVFAKSQSQNVADGLEDDDVPDAENDVGEDAGDDYDDELYVYDDDDEDARSRRTSGNKVAYKYHPPEDVRKRQFCTMAETFGYSPVEFAFLVEGWTQAERRSCLDRFYKIRKEQLAK